MTLQFEEQKPLRFTDSPQHHSNITPNPSPRRKSSSTSNDGSELYAPYDRATTIYIPGDYHGCQNEATHCLGCCIRTTDTNYRTETNLGFNYGPAPDPTYIPYSSEHSGTTMYGYGTDYAYDNPSSVSSHSGSRTPQRLPIHCHKRTPSNISNASSTTTSGSNVNPSFRLEDDCTYTPTHYFKRPPLEYDYTNNFSRQNSQDSSTERPSSLETTGNYTKLRSSLKRNNYQATQGHSGGNTPTNPTPPDSLTSDDSSYVSAKDSNCSVSRVRFSPTLLDLNVPGQHQDSTIPLQARRPKQRPTLADMEREFMS